MKETKTKDQQAQEYAEKKFPELLLTIEKEPWPNGAAIERRIENTIANLKADGYKYVSLRDCFNLELPDIFQRN